jgi:RHS repeat-associated protein
VCIDEYYGADGFLLYRGTDTWADPKTRVFVPFQGRILAEYCGGSTLGTLFDHPDELGSLSTAMDYATSHSAERLFFPFGELWTGSDLYDFPFRKYHPTQGRWISPDPERGSTSNPQLFNKYAYVGNEPTRMTDPLGLQTCSTFCYDPYYAIEFPGQCVGCPGALAQVDPCEDWYYAVTHAECPGPTGGPVNISFGCASAVGATATCTERTHLPGPIYGWPAGGDLCAGTDYPYFWWAWTCTGDYYCCMAKEGLASVQCEREGGVSGGRVNNYLEVRNSMMFTYANCCSRKPKLKPPTVTRPAR